VSTSEAVPTGEALSVCIVGMGPRGLSVLERIVTNAAAEPARPVHIDVVDPYPPGAGRVWRTDQPDRLLMNTVASRVTVYTDRTVDVAGRLREGPTLYEWARFQVLMGDLSQFPPDVAAELRGVGPDTCSTRRLFGHYLRWAYERVVATAASHITVRHHAKLAVALWDEPDGRPCVLLQTGDRLSARDAVVLAQGHYPVTPTPEEQALASFAVEQGLTYILPANPADVDLSMVRPGEPTLLHGLGPCFLDYVALLTEGRAGRFVREDDGRLTYLPSGLEPQLLAGSDEGPPTAAADVLRDSIGGPAHRVEQVRSLIEAGVLQLAGAGTRVRPHPERAVFVVEPAQTPGVTHEVTAMIEARLPGVDLRRTADPLLGWMLAHGSCTHHTVAEPGAEPSATGGIAVTGRPFHPVAVTGRCHPRRFVFGVPAQDAHWATGAGPGVDSVLLADADAISLAVLALATSGMTKVIS
jgi:hypothetical protein